MTDKSLLIIMGDEPRGTPQEDVMNFVKQMTSDVVNMALQQRMALIDTVMANARSLAIEHDLQKVCKEKLELQNLIVSMGKERTKETATFVDENVKLKERLKDISQKLEQEVIEKKTMELQLQI